MNRIKVKHLILTVSVLKIVLDTAVFCIHTLSIQNDNMTYLAYCLRNISIPWTLRWTNSVLQTVLWNSEVPLKLIKGSSVRRLVTAGQHPWKRLSLDYSFFLSQALLQQGLGMFTARSAIAGKGKKPTGQLSSPYQLKTWLRRCPKFLPSLLSTSRSADTCTEGFYKIIMSNGAGQQSWAAAVFGWTCIQPHLFFLMLICSGETSV